MPHYSRVQQQDPIAEKMKLLRRGNPLHIGGMIYRHARISPEDRSLPVRVAALAVAVADNGTRLYASCVALGEGKGLPSGIPYG